MGTIMRVAEAAVQDMMIVPVRIARPSPEGRSNGRQLGLNAKPLRLSKEPSLVAAEGRAGVHAFPLERHPVGPEISLLQHMRLNVAHRRQTKSSHMMGTAVTKQYEVGNSMLTKEVVKEDRP